MADSSIAITGGNVDTRTASNGDHRQCMVVADSATDNVTLVNTENELFVRSSTRPSDLGITATAAAASAVTLTIPAVAAKFAYIGFIEITAYSTVARTGGVTPVLVTTTNIPGSPVWTFASAAAVGTTDVRVWPLEQPMRSSTVNTATTIVCPATASILWRVNVRYYNSL